jgi:hypothetical protein
METIMVDQRDVRDVEDIERPSETFPAMTTPTEPKHHSQPHRGVDVLPSSSFRTGRFGRCSGTCRSSSSNWTS